MMIASTCYGKRMVSMRWENGVHQNKRIGYYDVGEFCTKLRRSLIFKISDIQEINRDSRIKFLL